MATLQRRPRTAPSRPALGDQHPGTQSTVADYIVMQIEQGVDPFNAAGVCGVTAQEFQAWMREGALVFSRLNNGADWSADFTPEQQDCAVFADQVGKAHSRHIALLEALAQSAARGQLAPKVTVRTKTVGGQVVEEHRTTETAMPDMDIVKWKLTKLEPAIYGDKATLSVTVTDLTDTPDVADSVERRMREIAAKLMGAVEATATEAGDTAGQGPELAPGSNSTEG